VEEDNPYYTSVDGVLFSKDMTKIVALPAKLKGVYEIPYGVTSIDDYQFESYFSGLKGIKLPSTVTKIGRDAFFGCSGLTIVEIPSSVTSIGAQAFVGCKDAHIKIDNSEENVTVGENAFYQCKKVTWLK
jgi:hypothetical protein